MNNFTQVFFSLKNKLKSNFVTTLGFALLMLISLNSFGQMTFTSGAGLTQSQNFDGLPLNTTANNINVAKIGQDWFRHDGTTQSQALTGNLVTSQNTSSLSHGVYNSATSASSTDRSIAMAASGSGVHRVGVRLVNSTGAIISGFSINGYVEKYRNGSSAAVTERVLFEYSLNATNLNNGTWTPVAALDLVEPDNATVQVATAVDGNLPLNRAAFSGAISSLTLANASEIWIRWRDADVSGTDAVLGLDDVSITATLSGCIAPTTAASNFDFTGTTQTQMPVSFTIGSGAGRVVIMNSSNTFTAPTAGSNPSANTVYGGGQQVVYNSTGNSFTVTGLNPDTTYYYSVYEYCDTERNYGSAFAGSNATLAYTVSSCKLQAPTTLTTNQGTPVSVNTIVLSSGLTDAAGQGAGVSSWIGYSAADTNPNTAGWTWVAASYLGDSTTYDEYQASIGGALASGTYYIASRFQIGSGAYTYGGVTDIWNNDSGTLTVNAVIPVVTGASLNGNVGTPFTYNIIATNAPTSYAVSSGTLPNGLTLNTTTGEISGTPTTAGSVSVDVTATNVGGTSTPATLSFTIGLANQTITFGALSSVTYGVAPYTLTATASSTLPVSFDSSNTSVATISGTTITIVGAGTTTITASQAGDSNYNPATNVQQSLTVNQKALTITGVTADNKIQDGTTAATLSGTPTLVGVEAVDNGNVTVTGTPTATFASAAPGTAIAVTVTGYTLGGTAAGNYSVSQPTGLTADITGLGTPVVNPATDILPTSFTANWDAVANAASYELEVSTSPTFGTNDLATNLVISEYLEGSSNNKYIEIYNGTGSSVDLSNYQLVNYSNGSLTVSSTLNLSGSLADGATYVIRNNSASVWTGTSNLATTNSVMTFNGNDVIALRYLGNNIDVVGVIGVGTNFAVDVTLTRNASVLSPSTTYSTLEWTSSAIDNVSNLGMHTINTGYIPDLLSGYPLNVGNVTTYNVTGLSPETTYHYRVRAVNGAAQSANSIVENVTTKPVSVTWDGTAWSNTNGPDADIEAVISGAYDTSVGGVQDEFTAKKLTVTSTPAGSLTIAAGTNVTVVNEVVNQLTETAFVVESDGNLIQTNPNIVNTNAITVKRLSSPIRRLDYTLWSSPVDGQQLQAFSPGTVSTRFYTYNPSTNFYVSTLPTGDFVTGTGYLIRSSNWLSDTDFNPWEGTFIGAPNNGDVTLSVANGTYNAIGNPYPSTIDADEFIGVNSITAPLYFWRKVNNLDAANNPTSSYATYTLAGGAGTAPNTAGGSSLVPDGTIQVGQGFIAQATSSSLVFSNTMRNGDVNSVFLRSGAANKSRIWLNLTNTTGVFSQALVAYMPTATTGIDAAIDGKFFETTLATQLSSIINGEEFAVQGRPAFTASDVVALGFKTQTEGNYTIAIDHVDGLFAAGQEVFLKDNLTNTVHNLTNAPYNFVATAGTANTRFEIVYESTLATQNPVLNENMVTIYKQNQNLVVNTGAFEIKDVKVYDIQGRLLVEQKDVNAATAKLAISSTNQVLIVKVTSKEGTIVTKKVVF